MGRAVIGFLVYDGRLPDLEAAAEQARAVDAAATVEIVATGAAGEYGTPYVAVVETAGVGPQAKDAGMVATCAPLRALAEVWEPRDRERARLIDGVKAARVAAARVAADEAAAAQAALDTAVTAAQDEGLEVPDGDQ